MLKSKDQEYCDLTQEMYDKVKAVQDKGNEKTVAEMRDLCQHLGMDVVSYLGEKALEAKSGKALYK